MRWWRSVWIANDRLLATLDFRAQFIVARKIERVFRNSFKAREIAFYDHLVSLLFQNVLHRYRWNTIYFAKRGSRDRQLPLSQAIQLGIQRFEQKWDYTVTTRFEVQAQTPSSEPCLSIADYANWAVYRAFTRGEMRYYKTIEDKVSLLVDLYDNASYPKNWYSRRNPFDITKVSIFSITWGNVDEVSIPRKAGAIWKSRLRPKCPGILR